MKPPGHEGLYAELVKLEQKKYKAQRSIRDLTAKKEKGILSADEYNQYKAKFDEALKKINESIADLRTDPLNRSWLTMSDGQAGSAGLVPFCCWIIQNLDKGLHRGGIVADLLYVYYQRFNSQASSNQHARDPASCVGGTGCADCRRAPVCWILYL